MEEISKYKKNVLIQIYNNQLNIGYIKSILFNTKDIYEKLQSDEVLKVFQFEDKEEEAELQSFYAHVLSKKDCCDYAFYIAEFFIEKEWRSCGIGKRTMLSLPKLLRDNLPERISCIYLLPGPLEKIDGQVQYIMDQYDLEKIKLKNNLFKFYVSVGFKRIANTEFFKEELNKIEDSAPIS